MDDAFITKDTKAILKKVEAYNTHESLKPNHQYEFLESYQNIFHLEDGLITQHNNVTYKEFSKDITFSIKCIPDS